jgi:hypothetical protein
LFFTRWVFTFLEKRILELLFVYCMPVWSKKRDLFLNKTEKAVGLCLLGRRWLLCVSQEDPFGDLDSFFRQGEV